MLQALLNRGLRVGAFKCGPDYIDPMFHSRIIGAELVPFSPLADSWLPENIQGLYLGGGYPELYAGQLSGNASMWLSIKSALMKGLPCIAGCGCFMYLTAYANRNTMCVEVCRVMWRKCLDSNMAKDYVVQCRVMWVFPC